MIKEENCIGHGEFVVNTCGELLRVRLPASLSVSVDLMNRREVERLRQVLLLWSFTMAKLEIFFKVCYISCFCVDESRIFLG